MKDTQSGSGAVLRAKEYLNSVVEGRTAALPGPYARQIAGLYGRIVNGTAFRCGGSKEPLPDWKENRPAADEAAYQGYLRLLRDAGWDGTEVNPWRT